MAFARPHWPDAGGYRTRLTAGRPGLSFAPLIHPRGPVNSSARKAEAQGAGQSNTGRSSAWTERRVRDAEVAGSNPVAPSCKWSPPGCRRGKFLRRQRRRPIPRYLCGPALGRGKRTRMDLHPVEKLPEAVVAAMHADRPSSAAGPGTAGGRMRIRADSKTANTSRPKPAKGSPLFPQRRRAKGAKMSRGMPPATKVAVRRPSGERARQRRTV